MEFSARHRERVKGELIGGCVDVLEFLKGTDFWFSESDWDGKILFLETSEEMIVTCFSFVGH